MQIFQNCLALAIIFSVAGSNIYWRWANDLAAIGLALTAACLACLAVEKVSIWRAHNQMREEHGKEWN